MRCSFLPWMHQQACNPCVKERSNGLEPTCFMALHHARICLPFPARARPPQPRGSCCEGFLGSHSFHRPFAMAPENNPKKTDQNDIEGLEYQFWRNMRFQPPLYGADVEGSLFDNDIQVMHAPHAFVPIQAVLRPRMSLSSNCCCVGPGVEPWQTRYHSKPHP